MKHAIALTKNMQMAAASIEEILARSINMPGLAIWDGDSGLGKTTAAAELANQHDAYYVRAFPIWTPTSMLAALCEEIGIEPSRSAMPMMKDIIQALSRDTRRPIFLDEADHLTDKRVLLETLRSLHDVTTTPIVMVGMANFRKAIVRRDDQFTNRISQWVEFKRVDEDDARGLAETCCEVALADDLVEKLRATVKGITRDILTGMSRIESFAKRKGLSKINAAQWGDRPFILKDSGRGRGTEAA